MIIQSLEAPSIGKPFVVTDSDVKIFSCQDDQDNFNLLLQYPKADFEDFYLTSPGSNSTNRSSIGSSSSSSICSNSLNYDDDSFVSWGDQSETSLNSDKRKHRRRVSSRRKPKKTVTFHPKVSVRTIPKLNKPSEEEFMTRWYQVYERNGVRFADYEEVVEIPHVNDMTQEEIDDSYMSDVELRAIQYECKALVRMMDEEDEDLRDVCVRGLDQHTPEYSRCRKATRQQAYDAVFEVQSYQAFQGVSAPELIAELCQKCSSSSVAEAKMVGISDAMAAV
jgi:hypothetical protein